jgi:F-type H+-transporting ATPase subunit gamma
VLRQMLPKYLEIKAYSAVLESLASEFTARRNAMKQATDAADDIIGALRRQYNRARQEEHHQGAARGGVRRGSP